jgi:uncharacterized protein (TIGR00730 family)
MAKAKKVVAVFGANRVSRGEPLYDLAEETGREIAGAGWTLLNGGYGGTMEATARGARERGGRVLGVPVAIYSSQVNPFVSESVMTQDLWERIRLMLGRSDAFIALDGSTGTLAEIGMAWEFIAKKLLPPKPLIFIGDFWAPLYRTVLSAPNSSEPTRGGIVRIEPTPKAAIDFLRAYWKDRGNEEV